MSWLRHAQRVGKQFVNPVEVKVGGLSMIFRVLPLYLTGREERSPKAPLGPFHTDASVYAAPPASGLRVTWMGHSILLIEIDGVRILVDPVWDKRASPWQGFGPARFYAAPLMLDQLPKVNVVLISHDHYDHLGEGTVRRLAAMEQTREARWMTSLGVGGILRQFGVAAGQITELDWTESVTVQEVTLTSVPTRHFSGRKLSNRFETLWSGFVLKGPEHTVYCGADSGWWEGFAEIGQTYGPFDLTMLEIGAFHELWKDIHLGPEGAMRAFAALGAQGLLMPIHWGLFDLALHGWRQPIERIYELAAERGVKLWSPEPGRPTEVERGVEVRSGWWRKR